MLISMHYSETLNINLKEGLLLMNNKIIDLQVMPHYLVLNQEVLHQSVFYRDENMEVILKVFIQLAKVLDMLEVLCQVQLMV